MKTIGLTLVAFLFAVAIAHAQPSLGADCGAGAVLNANAAGTVGKVTLGAGNQGSCTITIASHARTCYAIDETKANVYSNFATEYCTTTPTTIVLIAENYSADGDVIAYGSLNY